MKAIWSFWTKPFIDAQGEGLWSLHHYFYSWIISVKTISRFYNERELYTDSLGKELLVKNLGLKFDKVHVVFDSFQNINSNWWAIGKLLTYSLQTKPFIHFDSDVYLWDSLPDRLINADFCAQSPEYFNKYDNQSYYRLLDFENFIKIFEGWLPNYWQTHTQKINNFEAACCGIFGGNDIKNINIYAKTALDILLHSKNSQIWEYWYNIKQGNVLVEQFFLILYLNQINRKLKRKKSIEYLFKDNPFSNYSNTIYTHLISNSKNIDRNQRDIEEFVLYNFPEFIPQTVRTIELLKKDMKTF